MPRKKKDDKPWWAKNDSLWGGETFASTQTQRRLGIVSGDKFRVEKGPNSKTLIPHPQNEGTWKDSHSTRRPIVLTEIPGGRFARAFSMSVKIKRKSKPTPLCLIERRNGTVAITGDFTDPGASCGTASVERCDHAAPRRAARGGRAAPKRERRHAPLRVGTDDSIDKIAPWQRWERLPLRASAGTDDHPVTFTVEGPETRQNKRYSRLITVAAHEYFKIEDLHSLAGEGPAAYLVDDARWLRVVYDELVVQFEPQVGVAGSIKIIEEVGFRSVGRSCFAENQWIVRHAEGFTGGSLLKAAAAFKPFKEVRFAWPNSVAEYRRASTPAPKERRWWLDKIGVNSPPGERHIAVDGSGVVVAVLDDGVDTDHPNLVSRVVASLGRDYAFPPNAADFSDPRPKEQVSSPDLSDYHGTACAGLICSDGTKKQFLGVAPGCKLVAVRVINGPKLISEAKLAAAVRYATGVADVISCSWVGPKYSDVILALNETTQGRSDKGSVVVCAAGNDGTSVDFPASHGRAIAVGACGPEGEVTDYANVGNKIHVVAPSSYDDDSKVYSTDVTKENWGYNPGGVITGDTAGEFADEVGETSAATAIVAGVAALCLEANSNLTADDLWAVLQVTADPIVGPDEVEYDEQTGHSPEFGYGRVDAAAAVEEAKHWPAAQPPP